LPEGFEADWAVASPDRWEADRAEVGQHGGDSKRSMRPAAG
jgi:hypothetical protein